jgi:sporulation protein YlmC with PRC-barrel domain
MAQKNSGGGVKLTEFLTLEVVDRNGRHLGRVVELRCAGEPEHGDSRDSRIVTELIYGKAGWLERLGFKAIEERRVAWTSVIAIDSGKIVIDYQRGRDTFSERRHQNEEPLNELG